MHLVRKRADRTGEGTRHFDRGFSRKVRLIKYQITVLRKAVDRPERQRRVRRHRGIRAQADVGRVKDGCDRRAPGDTGTRDGLPDDEAGRAAHPEIRGRRGACIDRRARCRRILILRTEDTSGDSGRAGIRVIRTAQDPQAGVVLGQRDIRTHDLGVEGVVTRGSALQHHRSQVGRPDNGDGRSVTEDQRGVVGRASRQHVIAVSAR